MRYRSDVVGGVQVFAVAGTHTVSFGIAADDQARTGLLGFAIERIDHRTHERIVMHGYKVFRSRVPNPDQSTDVSTFDHPIQSLVWDDLSAQSNRGYDYLFHPLRGTPAALDGSAPPVTITIRTEPLTGQPHDVFFNRGVTSGQYYARQFHNAAPDEQPTKALTKQAYAWLGNGLDAALIAFIRSAQPGDALRGACYEFTYGPVLKELHAAFDRGVDVRIVVDEKVNEHTENVKAPDGTRKQVVVASFPREENLAAIEQLGFPPAALIPRVHRADSIAHNKFLVLLTGGVPTEVWTGSTNLTTGGVFGQANVGHLVRDPAVAARYLDYWTLLATDPGAATSKAKDPANIAFRQAVTVMSPLPALADIPTGITPVFSPRTDASALQLYVTLLAQASHLACATFAFGIPEDFRTALAQNTPAGPLCFLLLETQDGPRANSTKPFVRLNSKNNVYEASGAELRTPIGSWVVETDNRRIGLNTHVAFIHLKVLLHDPLGADPIVVTGSANFSAASTVDNDENMLIVRGDRRVADIYFTEFNRLWAHFQFRSVVERTGATNWQFLAEDDSWLGNYKPGALRAKRVDQYVTMAID